MQGSLIPSSTLKMHHWMSEIEVCLLQKAKEFTTVNVSLQMVFFLCRGHQSFNLSQLSTAGWSGAIPLRQEVQDQSYKHRHTHT